MVAEVAVTPVTTGVANPRGAKEYGSGIIPEMDENKNKCRRVITLNNNSTRAHIIHYSN